MDDMEVKPWFFTVVRAQGLRLIKPEKAWRPIVTVEIDKLYCYELLLGIDGQNPNLKDRFAFPEAPLSANVEIKVWHVPPSKKKKRNLKRHLVASASKTLGELVKRQELEPRIEVQLQCQSLNHRRISASKGKLQSGVALQVQLQPPPCSTLQNKEEQQQRDNLRSDSGYVSDSRCSLSDHTPSASPTLSAHDEDELSEPDECKPLLGGGEGLRQRTKRRRRKIKPYFLSSEDERNYETEYDSDSSSSSSSCVYDLTPSTSKSYKDPTPSDPIYISLPLTNTVLSWIAPSLLPRYTERIEVLPEPMGFAQRLVGKFTMYNELREATCESDFEVVFGRLKSEWTYVGGLLVALAAVDTAVFSISPDSIFTVPTSSTRTAIASSSIFSGLGIATDAYFLFRYTFSPTTTLIALTKDLFDSYLFFSISSRLPSLCMLLSSVSLMMFLVLAAYDVYPIGVLVACGGVGVVLSLQFLVYGAVWTTRKVVEGGRRGVSGVGWVVRKVTG